MYRQPSRPLAEITRTTTANTRTGLRESTQSMRDSHPSKSRGPSVRPKQKTQKNTMSLSKTRSKINKFTHNSHRKTGSKSRRNGFTGLNIISEEQNSKSYKPVVHHRVHRLTRNERIQQNRKNKSLQMLMSSQGTLEQQELNAQYKRLEELKNGTRNPQTRGNSFYRGQNKKPTWLKGWGIKI